MSLLSFPSLPELRERTSSKWREYPADVLPLFVAELDVHLAEPIRDALVAAIERGDTGYSAGCRDVADAFARFASQRWDWPVDPDQVTCTTDVSVVIVESLRRLIEPGDGVIVMPPIYPPFFDLPPEAGGVPVPVPLIDDGTSWSIDLDGVERAMANGAKAVLLCSPHNPLGLVHSHAQLAALADIVMRHDGYVISDEVHAPMTHRDSDFVPYLTVSDAARSHGVAAHSASKSWNVAGLKCAQFVTASGRMASALRSLPDEVRFRTSILGRIAGTVAYGSATDWLDELVAHIESNRRLLGRLLTEQLPSVRYREPRAGYLAWLGFDTDRWGTDPAKSVLERARVALNNGPLFGRQGTGHARLNFGCSPELLTDAITRIARAA